MKDKAGIPLIGSTIHLKNDASIGVTANMNGFFCLEIPHSMINDTLMVHFFGYLSEILPIKNLDEGEIKSIILKEKLNLLPEIAVYSKKSLAEEFSVQRLEKLDIYLSPISSGDPLRAIAILPASTNVSETANIELRGSSGDKSCVLLNGVPINNPVRNSQINGMGNFSLFNPEMIKTQTVYSGNPPLIYGNTIAGLVEIETNNKLESENVSFSTSLANIGVFADRKLSNKSFLQLYGNYQFSQPYLYINGRNFDYLNKFSTKDIGGNLNIRFTDRLSLNTYNYFISENYNADGYMYNQQGKHEAQKQRWFQVLNLEYKIPGVGFIRFDNGIDVAKTDYKFSIIENHQNDFYLYNSLNTKYFYRNFSLHAGISFGISTVKANSVFPEYYFAIGSDFPSYEKNTDLNNKNLESFLYLKYSLNNKLITSLGFRKNLTIDNQKDYCSYQISTKFNISDQQAVMFAGGNYNKYHLPSYNLTDFHLQNAKQLSFEYNLDINSFQIKPAVYYKKEKTFDWLSESDEINALKRNIWGIELFLGKSFNSFLVSGAYTHLNSHVSIGNLKYKSKNDMNYIIKFSAKYLNKNLWSINLNYLTRPGLHYTPVESSLYLDYFDRHRPIYGTVNDAKNGNYNSIDISVNKVFYIRNERLTVFVTMSNIYNNKNQDFPIYSEDYSTISDYWYYQKRQLYFGMQITI
ncbi:MAG: TonB-dependent receptor plug domain-containing protein [Dysgonamonadaceae bacterium]|nr:TonB-dependent receptor plug domain-containing protein [Dysgonamonadaceae bacterium]